jgi:hypothetical protein
MALGIRSLASRFSELFPRKVPVWPSVQIRPRSDALGAEGGPGQVYVTANSGDEWVARPVTSWITIKSGARGEGDGVLHYDVAQNNSNQYRSGEIAIGEARYGVLQAPRPYVQIPFIEEFDAEPLRWILEDHTRTSVVRVAEEGPDGGSCLVLFKSKKDEKPYQTQLYLPGIRTEAGANYHLSLWLRAESPAQVWLSFDQKNKPFGPCGLWEPIAVPTAWTPFTVHFKVAGPGCGFEMNRLSLVVGSVSGRLWVSKVSVTRDDPGGIR